MSLLRAVSGRSFALSTIGIVLAFLLGGCRPAPLEQIATEPEPAAKRSETSLADFVVHGPELYVDPRTPSRIWVLGRERDDAVAVDVSAHRRLSPELHLEARGSFGVVPLQDSDGAGRVARIFADERGATPRVTWSSAAASDDPAAKKGGWRPFGFRYARLTMADPATLAFAVQDSGEVWLSKPGERLRLLARVPEGRAVEHLLHDPKTGSMWALSYLQRQVPSHPELTELSAAADAGEPEALRLPPNQDIRGAVMGRDCGGELFVFLSEHKNRRRLFRVRESRSAELTAEYWTDASYHVEWYARDIAALAVPGHGATWLVASDGLRSARLMRPNSAGELESLLTFDVHEAPIGYAASDFDGDGTLDLATLSLDMTLRVDFGGPDGVFEEGAVAPCPP